MTFSNDALDRLAPAIPWQDDWSDVLRRAGEREAGRVAPRRFLGRRLVIAVVVLAAVLIPLAALAAANDWWFLRSGSAPRPTHGPVVVREGEWSGHAWQMVAYPSVTDGLCISVAPKGSDSSSAGAAMGCAPVAGVPRTSETKKSPDMTITFLSGSGGLLPSYVVGPVIEQASDVEIRFVGGRTLRVPTFAGPPPLNHIRFYATEIPTYPLGQRGDTPASPFEWIAGRDANGKLVACLLPKKAADGVSPLSDCR
jgi:hypothetical protein